MKQEIVRKQALRLKLFEEAVWCCKKSVCIENRTQVFGPESPRVICQSGNLLECSGHFDLANSSPGKCQSYTIDNSCITIM